MNYSSIGKISPLYSYWQSDQNTKDENERLLKANNESPASFLFTKEPYKWENLYQSIVREIINGDMGSVKGLKVLLSSVNSEQRAEMIQGFKKNKLFPAEVFLRLGK